jgi:hypothetical protein
MINKNFKPTNTMKSAAKAVFLSMAYTQTIRPIVEGYKRKILQKCKFKIDPKFWNEYEQDKTITDPKKAYLMTENDLAIYLKECQTEQKKAGLKTEKPEYCPLLVAEHTQIRAENILIDSMKPITGFDSTRFLSLENRAKLIDLSLRLLSPFVKREV